GEAAHEVRVGGQRRMHHLQRHGPVQPEVVGEVDGGHAAAGDARLDGVATVERRTYQRVGSREVHGRGVYGCSAGGEDAWACRRTGIRPASRAARPARTASRIAPAISTGSWARVTAVASRTASQPSSMACAASLAVPIPASMT